MTRLLVVMDCDTAWEEFEWARKREAAGRSYDADRRAAAEKHIEACFQCNAHLDMLACELVPTKAVPAATQEAATTTPEPAPGPDFNKYREAILREKGFSPTEVSFDTPLSSFQIVRLLVKFERRPGGKKIGVWFRNKVDRMTLRMLLNIIEAGLLKQDE